MTGNGPPYEPFLFSCVVDGAHCRFQNQAFHWAASLIHLARVPGSQIALHIVGSLAPDLAEWLRDMGVAIRPVETFGHPYCNKLQQLAPLGAADRPFVVMMDCDTVATAPASWVQPRYVAAKRVDTALPPPSILSNVFAAAGLGEPCWCESDLLPGAETRLTDRNNCNGGVYVIRRSFLDILAPAWHRWARWCVERHELFGPYASHIDQVSLALAARELRIDIEPLDRSYNFPTHLPLPPECDVDPFILHYHSHIDCQLLLKPTGLPRTDAAITRVNECFSALRRSAFLNATFFGARYELFPELGSGVGSAGEHVEYKRRVLKTLIRDPDLSVLDVGCGNLAATAHLPVRRYVGIDIAASAIAEARLQRPEWVFVAGDATTQHLSPADVVICLDVLIHQPSCARYRQLVNRLVSLTNSTLIVGAYDHEPVFTSSITFYHEPITETLAQYAEFGETSVVGRYRDVSVVVARKRRNRVHSRDMSAADFNIMSAVTDHPLYLRTSVDRARVEIGFFPAHNPRAIEYPWILAQIPENLASRTVLDVGAGLNPVPFMLADRGASVVTVDCHCEVRDPAQRTAWNEWGFLDYGKLDRRIISVHTAYEDYTPATLFDCIYSVSVIEHLATRIQSLWIERFAGQLKSNGLLLLTVDLVPDSDRLWNFREGQRVEAEEKHGTLQTIVGELRAAGFRVGHCGVKRNIPRSRVDVGFILAYRSPRPSVMSAGIQRASGPPSHNVDFLNATPRPYTAETLVATAGQDLTIRGWAVDLQSSALAGGVEVLVDGIPYESVYGLDRADVADFFRVSALGRAGFEMLLPGELLPRGRHCFQIRVVSGDRRTYWDGPEFTVECR